MTSINDLATAATIASSAVALHSSPTQQVAQPEITATAETSSPQSATQPASAPAAASEHASPPTPAPATPSPAPITLPAPISLPAASSAAHSTPATSVLVAPQISDPAQAQIPAPAPAPAPKSDGPVESMQVDSPAVAVASDVVPEEKRKPPVRGAFVIFEGMDRAGKTTQAKLLQMRCIEAGREVKFMRFPDRTTPIGQMIDAYLKGQTEIEDHVIHLLFSANRWEALRRIQEALSAGITIICDRYYHSGIVYSAAKQNPSLPLAWAKAPEVGLPRPDLVVFLDLEEKVARERGGWGGEVYEKGEMQRRVRELFWGLSMGDLGAASGNEGRRDVKDGSSGTIRVGGGNLETEKGEFRQEEEDLQIVDADLGIEELSDKVWEVVLPRLEAVEKGEVGDHVRVVR